MGSSPILATTFVFFLLWLFGFYAIGFLCFLHSRHIHSFIVAPQCHHQSARPPDARSLLSRVRKSLVQSVFCFLFFLKACRSRCTDVSMYVMIMFGHLLDGWSIRDMRAINRHR